MTGTNSIGFGKVNAARWLSEWIVVPIFFLKQSRTDFCRTRLNRSHPNGPNDRLYEKAHSESGKGDAAITSTELGLLNPGMKRSQMLAFTVP
jgi:hypothetical protein